MAEYYRIQLDEIYLTEDGTVEATPCRLNVSGVEALFQTVTGTTALAADGTVIVQTFAYTKGKPIEIRVGTLMSNVWADLLALFNEALETGASFEINGIGDAGDFTASVYPALPQPYGFESFIEGRIQNATFRLITT